ncbi:MAG: hypothetical protein Q4D04_12740 [Clostridia bacterium]|nr:hypothetical protein [Clostridia bacterium]
MMQSGDKKAPEGNKPKNNKQQQEDTANTANSAELTSDVPSEFEGMLSNLPEEERRVILKTVGMSMTMQRNNPETEVMRKMTPEIMEKIVDNDREATEFEYTDRKHSRWFILALVVIGLVFMAFVILSLKDNPDVMETVLTIVLSLVAGASGGYGAGYSKGLKSRND